MSAENIQPTFSVRYEEKRSRLTTFFRMVMVIPHLIMLWFLGIAVMFTLFAAWIVMSITGTYPQGLYDFHKSVIRMSTNVSAYFSLLTDDFPPFALSGPDVDNYAVQLVIPPRKEKYSRALAFFRLIVGIPVMIISYGMQIVWSLGMFAAWFVILVLGRQPKDLQDFTQLGYSYVARTGPYFMLNTEAWPKLTDPTDQLPAPAAASTIAPAPVQAAPPVTASPEAPTTQAPPPPAPSTQAPPPPPPPDQPNPFGQ